MFQSRVILSPAGSAANRKSDRAVRHPGPVLAALVFLSLKAGLPPAWCESLSGPRSLDLRGYTLTFDEEFDDFSMRAGSVGVWDPAYPDSPKGSSHEDELQWYVNPNYAPTAAAAPFRIEDGALVIAAEQTPLWLADRVEHYPYVSGIITTFSRFAQTYGYFEMRAKLPAGHGLWPAFWLVPQHPRWPPEIDVVEVFGGRPNTLNATVHTTRFGRPASIGFTATVPNTSQSYHTYGVDWEPNTITFYFDGQEIGHTATPPDCTVPMYMIANLAVGGWAGVPDKATQFPAELRIDYIRAYSRDPHATPVALQEISSPDGADTTPVGVTIGRLLPKASAVPKPARRGRALSRKSGAVRALGLPLPAAHIAWETIRLPGLRQPGLAHSLK